MNRISKSPTINPMESLNSSRQNRVGINAKTKDNEGSSTLNSSLVSSRRKSLITPGFTSPTKTALMVTAGERALESTLDSTTKTLTMYKNRLNTLIQQNAELQKQAKQQETDAIEVMGALRDQSEKKDREIIQLRTLSDQTKLDFEKERKEIHLSYAKKIEELNNIITEKDATIRELEQEVAAVKDFKKKRSELLKETETQKAQMEEMEQRYKESIVRIERKYFEEKLRMQKETNKHISELAASAHREAVAALDETTKEIYRENLKLTDELKNHVTSEEEIMKQNSKLTKLNSQLSQQKETNDLIVREKISMTKAQNQTIRELEGKIMTLESTLGHCIHEFEVERELLRDSTKAEVLKMKKVAAQLKQNLDRKSAEMRYIKKLALHILDQRTQVEKFFMDALDYVREEIRKDSREKVKQKKNAYTKHKNTCILPSTEHVVPKQAFDESLTIQQIKEQSHLHLVEISNLSWSEKENVLRVLFARMNGLLGTDPNDPVETVKKREDDALKSDQPTSSMEDVESKLREMDIED
ncbi:hypothetical protein HMI54_006108 [Coelomomyces lativittatus]|nr:hypothetical protein HMI54_006108 [Coelomomyces lativittatus]KAJ1509681.1 hypothetical protein HMI55_007298 [Coelomomyces lativittatus]KAJ1511125.1 hypothetical protein HMI56_005783 [Coelomomyces lativittatus]